MTLLIHPGFHKTGTSWLQNQLFVDGRLFNKMFGHGEIYDLIVAPHALGFDAVTARDTIAGRRSAADSAIVDIISSETLCGNPLTGRRNSKAIADRLVQATGPAKVLFTIREQASILKSTYLQYVKRGGRMTLARFVDYRPEPEYPSFDMEQLVPCRLVEYYASLYGEGNVIVLPQEALLRERDLYFEELIKFVTGAPPPPSISISATPPSAKSPPASGIFLLRLASHFLRTPVNTDPVIPAEPIGKVLLAAGYRWKLGNKRADKVLRAEIAEMVRGRFRADNDRLQRYCPFDLAQYGYETGVGA